MPRRHRLAEGLLASSWVAAVGYSMIWQVPPAALDPLARGGAEGVRVHRQLLASARPGPRILTGMPLRVARPFAAQRSGVTSAPASKRASRSREVDRLGVRPEGLERHRLLHVRAAQLAHPHVDRVLAALEARPLLGARARAGALLAAAGGLAACPSPRRGPTRLRGVREPGAGLSECSPMRSLVGHRVLLDLHEMPDGVDMPATCGVSVELDRLADPAQAERAQRVALLAVGAVARA